MTDVLLRDALCLGGPHFDGAIARYDTLFERLRLRRQAQERNVKMETQVFAGHLVVRAC